NLDMVPRTRDIRTLLDYVYKFEQKDEVRDLITRFRKTLTSLERSYTDARYGFIDYDMNDGKECLNIMEIIFNVIKVG
ncbi:MAG: HEPN domain-containing protein, partial [Sulfolobus sp.]|nr:HEPN domain-containing protein [Sulfolobus sp.]